jgi:Protein of unknown function (DUF1549)/Protein of unknown function (DUF1553)/Planctomycete cytochrome C/Concanavalin A-like lectin/glucanases superfamily
MKRPASTSSTIFGFVARIVLVGLAALSAERLSAAQPQSAKIEFNRDIRPILSDKCFACHGPDSAKRQAGLRLDHRDSATAEHDGVRAIVPGEAAKSDLVRRIRSSDPDEQMPPKSSNIPLTAAEIDRLQRWIDEGAEYQPHWSLIAPRAVPPPTSALPNEGREVPGSAPVSDTREVSPSRNPIDAFIRARLAELHLSPSPEAERTTLIRRVSFDLTGLPPTPAEVESFLADQSPDALEKLVDRLLASPRYGERMATNWLDAARYADTNGYQTDGPRFMWRWRDWVIDAFNQNQPFDEFTIDQLAGDLLPRETSLVSSPPSSEQKPRVPGPNGEATGNATVRSVPTIADARLIATGFNRNHRGNAEGGIIPEEFRVEYVVDRVETTATVWLGLTVGCARCHDHKYDPISQREFYQLFAYFNQVPEPGKYIRNDNSMPYLPAPTPDQQRKLSALMQEREAAESAWRAMDADVMHGANELAAKIRSHAKPIDWNFADGLDSHIAFDGSSRVEWVRRPSDSKSEETGGRAGRASYETHDATWRDGDATFAVGRLEQAAQFDGKRWIDAGDIADFADDESFAISCWIKPAGNVAMTILARMDHENASRGFELRREASGRLQALFSGRILDDLIRIETKSTIPDNRWTHVFVAYDGSSAARGVAIRLDGEPAEFTVITDLLSNPIRVKRPLSIGAGGSASPFVGLIDELRCYRGRLTTETAMALAAGDTISQIAAAPLNEHTPPTQLAKLREYYLAEHAPESQRLARQMMFDARTQYGKYLATIPTTMVMQDMPQRRETYLLKRGEYDKPGERVEAGLPSALVAATQFRAGDASPPVPRPDSEFTTNRPTDGRRSDGEPTNRLDLARWLVASDNPLAARVTVNRLWQTLFGIGLVKTAEDFGTQGESPSHPELLDWLAVEFRGPVSRIRSSESNEGKGDDTRDAVGLTSSGLSEHRTLKPENSLRPAWDVKRTIRQLVTSATYRQSASASDALLARDPDNRWLARGPRFRLPAEMIRDAALAASGLLVETLGGPSVKPYQPPGLWEELSADAVPGPFSIYVQDHGANLYRRSLYTYRKRTIPPPALASFDASTREACRVSLPRTNTPLQALDLMNDVTYLEAARVLAERAMAEGGASPDSRITWAFRRVLSRDPSDAEWKILVDGFTRRLTFYQQHQPEAEKITQLGESPADTSLAPAEVAAYAATVSVMLNVDEFVERP